MSGFQTVLFLAMWLLAAGLGGMLLLLFRQIRRASIRASAPAAEPLSPGALLPEAIPILDRGEVRFIGFDESKIQAVGIVNAACGECAAFERALARASIAADITLLSMPTSDKRVKTRERPSSWRVYGGVPSPEMHALGVDAVPFLYFVARGTVLAGGRPANEGEVGALWDAAVHRSQELEWTS